MRLDELNQIKKKVNFKRLETIDQSKLNNNSVTKKDESKQGVSSSKRRFSLNDKGDDKSDKIQP